MEKQEAQTLDYASRFEKYFARAVAQKAAKSISDGAEMEFQVGPESFTFTKSGGQNTVKPGKARAPQLLFTLTPSAADSILEQGSDDIGAIGVHIAKMIASPENDLKVSIKFKAGFLSLFSNGYFGVLTSGGSQFASFLASKGLSGMGAIKDVLKKMKA